MPRLSLYMNIYILRHATAAEGGTDGILSDADRPLTSKGERRTLRAADAMGEMGLEFDCVLTSPLKRAHQTGEIVAHALGIQKRLKTVPHLAPGGSTRRLIESIKSHSPPAEDVLLVGHEPYLSDLIALLVFGEARAGVAMRKGGLCKLSAEALRNGRCASLEWLLTPKQLCLIG